MRNIHRVTVGENIEFKSRVPQMLNPLDLVVSVVDKTLIKEGELLESPHHHIGFKNALFETLQSCVLSSLRQVPPVVRQIGLFLKQTEHRYMTFRIASKDGTVTTVQTGHQVFLCVWVEMNHTTHHNKKREQRFNTRLQCITLRWIEHRFGQGKGGNNHDVVGVEIVRGRKTAKSGVCVCYSSSPSLNTTSRPHIHIKHHKVTGDHIPNGNVP